VTEFCAEIDLIIRRELICFFKQFIEDFHFFSLQNVSSIFGFKIDSAKVKVSYTVQFLEDGAVSYVVT
jgi:hypothetical protein